MSRMRMLSASRLRRGLGAELRSVGREVGLGVVEALRERPEDKEPDDGRARQLARGAMRGLDEGLEDEHFQQSLAKAIARAVDAALTSAFARSPLLEELSEDAAQAFARGALREVATDLGEGGQGPLTRSLGASVQRVARDGASALTTPLALLAVAAGLGADGRDSLAQGLTAHAGHGVARVDGLLSRAEGSTRPAPW